MSLAHRMFKKAFQRGRSERRGEALTLFTSPPTAFGTFSRCMLSL